MGEIVQDRDWGDQQLETMGHLRKFLSVLTVLTLAPIPVSAQGVTFRNIEFKFRFVYPDGWKQATPRGPNVRALIEGPQGRQANCNIVVRRVPSLAKFSRQELIADSFSTVWSEADWLEMLGSKFAGATIRERRLTKASNYPVQFSVLETPYETVAAKIHMVMVQFVTLTPGILWHFGCAAGGKDLEEAQRNYGYMRPQFLSVLSSFVFEEAFY